MADGVALLRLLTARDAQQSAPFTRLFAAYALLLYRPAPVAIAAAASLGATPNRNSTAVVSAAANSALVERLKGELNDSYRQNAAQARTMLDLMNQHSEDKEELTKWTAQAAAAKAALGEANIARHAAEEREATSQKVIVALMAEVSAANSKSEGLHAAMERANARQTEANKEAEAARTREAQLRRELDRALEAINKLNEQLFALFAQRNAALPASVPNSASGSPAVSRSGSRVMGRITEVDDEVIAVVARKPSAVRRTIEAHIDGATSLRYTPSGNALASTGGDACVKVWDALAATPIKTFRGPTRALLSAAFSINNEMLVGSCNDSNVWVWQYSSERLLHKLTGHTDKVAASAIAGLDRLVSGSHDRTLKHWDLARGFCLRTVLCGSKVNDVQFTRGGKLALSAHLDKCVRMYDITTGECVHEIAVHTAAVTSVCVAPASNYILTNSRDNTLKLLDLRYTGAPEPVRTFKDERYRNACDWNSAALSADEGLVAAGGGDGRLFLWNAQTGALEVSLQSLSAPISACAFHPAGSQLAVSHLDKHLQLWE